MLKQMTISIEEDVYNTLAPFAEQHALGDFIAQLVRSHDAEREQKEPLIDPRLKGVVNPSLRGTVKITGDIIGPFFEEWENALDEGDGIY
jgi:hypothetical protein